ncbi:MAG TPA: ABC transporter substrate-binding protein [Stellaceae bacterium]|nr:ABC transporter substrate-binding protein [Stellaceae bacterium]
MKRALDFVAVAALVGALGTGIAARAAAETIPVIVKDTTAQYWQIVLAGARAAGRDLHIDVPAMGAQSESDISGQISALENAVSGKPAAIVIAPTQAAALANPIAEASQKVKIIGIDSAANTDTFTAFLSTDNTHGGAVAADALAEAIKAKTGAAKGDVALIVSLPGVGSLDQRTKGFKDELAQKWPDIKIKAERIGDGQATSGLNIMTDLITGNPNLKGVFASNLTMAQGASQALAENRDSGIVMVGFDSDPKLVKMLSDGVIAGLVVQDPYRMGYDGVKTAYAVAKGEKVDKQIDTGVTLVSKANLGDPKIQQLVNPKTD